VYVHLLHLHSPLRNVARVDPDAALADPGPVQAPRSPSAAAPSESQEQKRLAEERQRIQSVMTELSRVANSLREKQKEGLSELKQAAIEIGLAVAQRLIHEALDHGAFGIEKLVEEAIAKLGSPKECDLYLNPEDITLLKKGLGDDRRLVDEGSSIRILADGSLARGSCRAEAGDLLVLSDLKTHLAEIRGHLLGQLDSA
jgi:flagellar biosynthesis/type III secretory pathway protein FliH